jgi:hypothetical protein
MFTLQSPLLFYYTYRYNFLSQLLITLSMLHTHAYVYSPFSISILHHTTTWDHHLCYLYYYR